MKRNPITAIVAAAAVVIVPLATAPVAMTAPKASPAQSHAHGHTLGEWMVRYFEWMLGVGPNGGNGLTFLPLPAGEYVSGSFTLDDPGILEGDLELTVKPGQSFMIPITAWLGESYLDGSVDDPVPDASWKLGDFHVTIDGRTVVAKAAGESSPYYVPLTYFSEPIVYDEPSSYGSVAAHWVQGFGFVHSPLNPGRHVMKLHSLFLAENYGLGVQYENTWIINVTQ
jgi:hypothetical protein